MQDPLFFLFACFLDLDLIFPPPSALLPPFLLHFRSPAENSPLPRFPWSFSSVLPFFISAHLLWYANFFHACSFCGRVFWRPRFDLLSSQSTSPPPLIGSPLNARLHKSRFAISSSSICLPYSPHVFDLSCPSFPSSTQHFCPPRRPLPPPQRFPFRRDSLLFTALSSPPSYVQKFRRSLISGLFPKLRLRYPHPSPF